MGQGITSANAFAASAHSALTSNIVKNAWRSLVQHNIDNNEASNLCRRTCSAQHTKRHSLGKIDYPVICLNCSVLIISLLCHPDCLQTPRLWLRVHWWSLRNELLCQRVLSWYHLGHQAARSILRCNGARNLLDFANRQLQVHTAVVPCSLTAAHGLDATSSVDGRKGAYEPNRVYTPDHYNKLAADSDSSVKSSARNTMPETKYRVWKLQRDCVM